MRIDRHLHLVVPLIDGDGKDRKVRGYVHSAAVSSAIFHAYYKPMSRALNAMYTQGIGLMNARVSHLALKEAAIELKMWEGEAGVERGLMNEIYRLTNVIVPGKNGWESIPYESAKARHDISAEEADEVEGAICFFCLASCLHRRAEASEIVNSASGLWGARIESSNSMEFLNSLRTSKEAESSGERATA